MNPTEQKDRRTAVQKLEVDFERTKEDLTLLLEQGLAAQHDAHRRLVQQHELAITGQQRALAELRTEFVDGLTAEARRVTDLTCMGGESVLRRGFWGRLRWLFLGT